VLAEAIIANPAAAATRRLSDWLAVVAAVTVAAICLPLAGTLYKPPAAKPQVPSAAAPAPGDLKFEGKPGTVEVRFPRGTPLYQVELAVRTLDLTPLEARPELGIYVFRWPTVSIQRISDSQAQVLFPPHAKQATMTSFLADHQLSFVRWLSDAANGWHVALVDLPTVAVSPEPLGDGTYAARVPDGVDLGSVQRLLEAAGYSFLGYDPSANRVTFAEPPVIASFPVPAPAVSTATPVKSKPITLPVPQRPKALIYVQFTSGRQPDFSRYGGQLISIARANIAVVSVDAAATKAEVQLLSEAPGVICASAAATGCGSTVAGTVQNTISSPVAVATQQLATGASAGPAPARARSVGSGAAVTGAVPLEVRLTGFAAAAQVVWTIAGPAGNRKVVASHPVAAGTGVWSATELWDSAQLPDGTYSVTATATEASGRSAQSTTAIRIENTAPSAPLDLVAAVSGPDVRLTWSQPSSPNLALFRVLRDGLQVAQLPSNQRFFVDAGAANASHRYQVISVDSGGRAGQASQPSTTGSPATTGSTPAPAPTVAAFAADGEPVKAGGLVGDRALLVSQVPSLGEFHFEFNTQASSGWTALPGTATCGSESCQQEWDLRSAAAGPYLVRSVVAGTASQVLQVEHRTQAVTSPSGLTAIATGRAVRLQWAAVSGAHAYRVYRISAGIRSPLGETTVPAYVDTSPVSATQYQVAALDGLGDESSPSAPLASVESASAAPPASAGLAAPTGVAALAEPGSVVLTWTSVPGAAAYLVMRSEGAGSPFAPAGLASSSLFVDHPDGLGRALQYELEAISGGGLGLPSAPAGAVFIPSGQGTRTATGAVGWNATLAPTGVRVAVAGASTRVTWSPAPGTPAGTTYDVYRFDEQTGGFVLAAAGVDGNSWSDPTLAPQTEYGYVVTANRPDGRQSSYSEPAWTVTGARHLDGYAGESPSVTAATQVSEVVAGDAVALSSEASGRNISDVRFEIAPDGGSWSLVSDGRPSLPAPGDPSQPWVTGAGALTYTSLLRTVGLTPGEYQVRATAVDGFGRSAESVTRLRIDADAARGPPASWLELTAIANSNRVHLSWSAAEGATYEIRRSLLGVDGPFDTLASTTGATYDDGALTAGASYTYQVVAIVPGRPTAVSASVTGTPSDSFTPEGTANAGWAALQLLDPTLGGELALDTASAPLAPDLPTGLVASGDSLQLALRSLVSGQVVSGIGATAAIAQFPGESAWNWDPSSQAWTGVESGRLQLSALIARATGRPTTLPARDGRADLPDRRGAFQRTFENPDGSFTSVLSTTPVNYANEYGQWLPVNDQLVSAADAGYRWVNAADAFEAEFAPTSEGAFVRFGQGNAVYSVSLVGASNASGNAAGAQVWYPDALPGVDAGYRVTSNGIKETLVLQDATAPTTFRFDLQGPALRSLSATQNADGSWLFRDPAGEAAFRLEAPSAVTKADLGTPSTNRHASLQVVQQGDGYAALLSVDPTWLAGLGGRYPVFVDPTVTLQPAANANNYDAGFAVNVSNAAANVGTFLPIGTDSSNTWRSAVRFDVSSLTGMSVTQANLQLYYNGACISTSSPGCPNTSHQVDVHRMTGAWTTSSTSGQLQYDSAILSSFTLAAGAADQWMTWSVTGTVQNWVGGTQPNDGLLLNRDPDSSLNLSGPAPPSMEATASPGLTPELVVTYVSDAVTLSQPSSIHSNGADLGWSKYTGPSGAAFSQYAVHRSLTPNFTPSSATQLAVITDIANNTYRDTTAAPNSTFYYAVVANSSKSNEVTVNMPADGTASLTIQPSPQDTYMVYSTTLVNCANYGADSNIIVGTDASDIMRGLVAFNTSRLPAGASITKATLSLYNTTGPSAAMTLHAYPVKTAWKEGTGAHSPATCTGDGATWYESTGGVPWVNLGGDYNSSVSSGALSIAASQLPQVNNVDVTSIVANWASGASANLGFLLRSDSEALAAGDYLTFASNDYTGSASVQPELQVTYNDGSHATAPTVAITSPSSGSTVLGSSLTLTASASDDRYVQSVQFYQGTSAIGSPITSAPYTYTWTAPSSGTYSFTAVATDDAGNKTTSSAVSVTVTAPAVPTVSITSPASNATLTGTVNVSVSASSSYLSSVELYVDSIRLNTWTGSSGTFTYAWNTLDGTVYDGSHTLTAIAYDSYGQSTTSTAVPVTLANTTGTMYQSTISNTTMVPTEVVDAGTTPQNTYNVTLQISNTSGSSWSNVYLRYRWISSDPTGSPSSDSTNLTAISLGKGKSTTYTASVASPSLGAGLSAALYTLTFDLWDATNSVYFGQKGNQPLSNPVIVSKALSVALGLEKYYEYSHDPVGAGMMHMVNVANGDSLLNWVPFTDPGIGLASVVELTYNSLENHSDSPAGNNWSLSVSTLTRFGLPLDVHPNNADTNTSNRWIGLVDADGTYHKFQGALDSSGNAYYVEPPGVHLYLRQVSTTDTTLQGRYWAFTRPDGTTFYYDSLGYPTATVDLNGNTVTYTLTQVPTTDPGSHGAYHITAVTDQAGQGTTPAPNRSINITYYSKSDNVKPQVRGNVKAIAEHDGRELDFTYYEDGNLLSITEKGGTNADGSVLASRSWVFTYTTSSGSGPAIGTATNGDATRESPDPKTSNESTRLFSVSDPDGHLSGGTYHETSFAYITSGQDKWKLASFTTRDGQQSTLSYNDTTLTTTLTAPLSRTNTYTYDSSGRPTQIVNALNQSTSLQWSADNQMAKLTEPNSQALTYTYDANGQLTDEIDELGDDTRIGYQYVVVDSNDTSSHWCPSTGTVNGSPCNPRTVAHISQLHTKTDPLGVTNGAGYQWTFNVQSTTGNLLSVSDPLNETTSYTYNSSGELLTITEPGQTISTSYKAYDANGLPTCVTDPLGGMTQMGYDSAGVLQWVMDPNHSSGSCNATKDPTKETVYYYDSFGRLDQVSATKSTAFDPKLIWVDTSYDANDNVVKQLGPHYTTGIIDDTANADTTTSTYDVMDRVTGTTDPRSDSTSYAYDAAGRLVKVTQPMGQGLTNNTYTLNDIYDAGDELIETTRYHIDSSGVSHTYNEFFCYDSVGNQVSDTQPDGAYTSVSCPATQATNNYSTTYTYDAAHRLIGTVDGDSHKNSNGYSDYRTYDRDSNLLSETDASGNQTNFTYDQLNRKTRVDKPFMSGHNATTLTIYDQDGNVSKTISPRAYDASTDKATFTRFVTAYHYDADHHLTRTDLPYDPTSTDPNQNTEYYLHRAYDADGHLIWSSLPVTTTDPTQVGASSKTILQYFDPGWIYTSQDPGQPRIHFDYDASGRQTKRTPENSSGVVDTSQTTTWDYFPGGLLKDIVDQQGQQITYTYNADNLLTATHDASGLTSSVAVPVDTQNTYDDLGRLTREDLKKTSDSSWTFNSYGYDANGNVTDATENGVESSPGGTVSNAGRTLHYDYDQANWLTDQIDYGTSSAASDDTKVINSFLANGWASGREEDTWNGAAFALKQKTTFDYYANGLVHDLTTVNAAATTLESHTVSYLDSSGLYVDGNRTSDAFTKQAPSGSTGSCTSTCTATWTYDPRDRLLQAADGHGGTYTYTVDPLGNLQSESDPGGVSKSYTYHGNQLATMATGGVTYQYWYDALGREQCVTTGASSSSICSVAAGQTASTSLVAAYEYDYQDRLIGYQTYSAGSLGNQADYTYDALNRTYQETECHSASACSSSSGGQTTTFSYIGMSDQLTQETISSGTSLASPGATTEVKQYDYDIYGHRLTLSDTPYSGGVAQTSTTYGYGYDEHGSTSLLTDPSGNVKATYGYQPYGASDSALTQNSFGSSGDPNPYRYSGKRYDSGSGSYNMGARYFGTDISHFLTPDLFRGALQNVGLSLNPLSMDRYGLAGGNPTSFSEWDGHVAVADDTSAASIDSPSTSDPASSDSLMSSQQSVAGGWWGAVQGGLNWVSGTVSASLASDQAGWNALGGLGSIRPDWSQLNSTNLENAGAGWLDAAAGTVASAAPPLQLLDQLGVIDTSSIATSGLNALGAGINTNSDAYSYGKIGFMAGSLAAGGAVGVAGAGAAPEAAGAALRPIVIGENMERVNAAASAFDAEIYGGFDNVDGLTGSDLDEARLSHNSEWLRAGMAEGRRVIDIGPDPGNELFPGVTKDAYAMELYELESGGYTNIMQPYDMPVSIGAR
jgi:RHS repeat-associated protein